MRHHVLLFLSRFEKLNHCVAELGFCCGPIAGSLTPVLPAVRQELEANPSNYDAWFDLLRLVESEGDPETIRETYERAIANVPPTRVRKPLPTCRPHAYVNHC